MKIKQNVHLIALIIILLLLACDKNINNSSTPDNTLSLSWNHCDVISYNYNDVLDSLVDYVSWSTDIGTIDSNGFWLYAPTLSDVDDSLSVTITAKDSLQNETDLIVKINFTNDAPTIDCSEAPFNVKAGKATMFHIRATDDCDIIYFSMVSGPATVNSTTGLVTINAPADINTQTIVIKASDGNASSTCEFDILVQTGSLYKIEIPQVGNSAEPVYQGQHVEVPVNLKSGNVIDGFDLLIGYDNNALSFQGAAAGKDLLDDSWEYFTYRYGIYGDCSNNCPSALLRLTAIAETNNGPNHPTIDGVKELAVLDFLVTNDRTYECQTIPIRFFWLDCGDNVLSVGFGDELHISEVVFDGDEVLFPPDGVEIQDSLYGFPTYFGTQTECFVELSNRPIQIADVSFNNGSVSIACAGIIDSRGDLNLNNVANEIADAVLYANYFVYGLSVFTVNTEGQLATSDVNADGLTLSVADLAYLIRIIIGDALPYTNLTPINATLTLINGILNIDKEMGAMVIVIEGNDTPILLAENMTMEYNFDGTNTHILVYSLKGNSFTSDFMKVLGNIVSIEFGSAEGAMVIL